jgi:hypothetical protein
VCGLRSGFGSGGTGCPESRCGRQGRGGESCAVPIGPREAHPHKCQKRHKMHRLTCILSPYRLRIGMAVARILSRTESEEILHAQPVGSAVLRHKSPSMFVVSFVTEDGIVHAGFEQVGTQFVTPSGRTFDSMQVSCSVKCLQTVHMLVN